ncbi:MerR family transcriptional regulator [Frondihabitans sp. PAMC 28766]|uniref:MerR family transcriptional regulator n=1 Tax=Frondihabitans sp. PAMC 28766 TaxID=1795630 RepID=UPI001EF4E7E2|nr:MerR family transcriptional regulator [Frondihabitans sp. PAMC 28766]
MRIGDVAHRAGVSARALRYYEEQGLLTSERTASGQRTYAESAVEKVQLIQQFFAAGLASRTIAQLLPCVDTGTSSPEVFDLLGQNAPGSPRRWRRWPPRATPSIE